VLQSNYNLLERRELEGDLLRVARRRRIDVCAYYALATGYLTGKYGNKADFSKSARAALVLSGVNARF
jgi:aryl-alcohol dehydrogenase-like predicted oxidoreductase